MKKVSPAGSGDLCVLLVEDNEHMRALLRTLLKAMGIRRIVECTEGSEALRQISVVKPDFILTDYSMTPMDGLYFTRAIRRLEDESECVVPVIMVTGHTERRRIQAARDAGVTEILAKPVTAAALYHRIEEIVLRPRPFVRSPEYCGPCRRRHAKPDYAGPWRRATDEGMGDTVAIDAPDVVQGPKPHVQELR
jgi:two-component system chemotaxis response regulator CheY